MGEVMGGRLDHDVQIAMERLVEICMQAGHEVDPVSLPRLDLGIATYYVVADAEASANLARYDGVRFGFRAARARDVGDLYRRTRGRGFGAEVKRRIMLGTYVLSAGYYDHYYLSALRLRHQMREDFRSVFANVDFLLSPTAPTAAFAIGERTDDPLAMYASDVFTVPASLAGLPAVSLPVGKTQTGLPIGVQLWGPPRSDARLLVAAACLEELIAYDPH
jgi:aspartyl-tRNA(Asn)/glutamyl-tRNA(Gln) amidotransferase subunit A